MPKHASLETVQESPIILKRRNLWRVPGGLPAYGRMAVSGHADMRKVDPQSQARSLEERLLARAVGLSFGEFQRKFAYLFSLENSTKIATSMTGHPDIRDGALRIHDQVRVARDFDFFEQTIKLNETITKSAKKYGVLVMGPLTEYKTPYYMAELHRIFVSEGLPEYGPKPGLLLTGRNGTTGVLSEEMSTFGLYSEM